ncbi:MAG: hypothetical protein Harvfovirus8_6 [Harvfovirus sp.]|uniref:Uncharacterized protein n=1 Tax=Harvfovirus sp. TaxID=2487768 RepID=A0A3G5A0X2_9VIRU|nr:MAG: hypothetical protein Harvfovirus8_6 [Harvfovirus sp.]
MDTKKLVKIFKLGNIAPEKNIVYKEAVKMKDKIVVPIEYLDNDESVPLFIQIPSLYLKDVDENGLVLSLTETTAQQLKALDTRVITDIKGIIQRAKKLHDGRLLSKKFIYNAAVHIIENDQGLTDKAYPDGVLKLPTPLKIFNDNSQQPLKDYCLKDFIGVNVTSIVEVNSVIIKDCTVFIYLKTHQMKITYPVLDKYNLDEYSFIDDDDDVIVPEKKLNVLPPKNMLFKLFNTMNPTQSGGMIIKELDNSENSVSDETEEVPDEEPQVKKYFVRK